MVVKTIPFEILSHKRIVCSLYKRALRNIEDHLLEPEYRRYEQVILRARFDANKNCPDPVKAKQLVKDGEEELHVYRHYQPGNWFESPNGIGYERELHFPDNLVDYWHPLEKAMYPVYFARREERKKEYIEWYNKTYGKPSAEGLDH